MKVPNFVKIRQEKGVTSFTRKIYYLRFSEKHNRYHKFELCGWEKMEGNFTELTLRRVMESDGVREKCCCPKEGWCSWCKKHPNVPKATHGSNKKEVSL